MKIVYISFLVFNYVSFMLSRFFNPVSARHFWKNQIFAVKKLSQTLNYHKIAIIECHCSKCLTTKKFCHRPIWPIKRAEEKRRLKLATISVIYL